MNACAISTFCASLGSYKCAFFLPAYCCCADSILGAFEAYIGPRNYSMILGFGITFIVCYLTLGIMSCVLPDVPAKTVKQTLQIQSVPQHGMQMQMQMPGAQYQMPQQYQQIQMMPQQPQQVLQQVVQQPQPQPQAVANQFQPPQQPVQQAAQDVQPITSPVTNGNDQFPPNMGQAGPMMF